MAEHGHGGLNPGSFLEAVLTAAAQKSLTVASALRLIFLSRKAGDEGYVWWKRARLAEHWDVHPTTITRDYEQWAELGLVKIRPNPLKASAKLIIFPWSEVWDDAVWEDKEKTSTRNFEILKLWIRAWPLYSGRARNALAPEAGSPLLFIAKIRS